MASDSADDDILGPEHPKVVPGICGVTVHGESAIEWICVKKPHAKIYTRKTTTRRNSAGDLIFSNNPTADRHYFVNRWPNRKSISGMEQG